MKKIGLIVLIFSLLVSMTPVVLAEDICIQAKNATCDNVATINGDQVKKNCEEGIFQKYSITLISCKNQVETERQKLKSQLEDIEQQEKSTEWYLSKLNLDVRYLNYEIANLNLSIFQLESEIQKREEAIGELEKALAKQKLILSEALRQVYEYDITSYMEVLIGYGSLSDFESKLMEMDKIQIELRTAVSEIQAAREQMEKERKAMEEDLEENEEYKKVQEYSKYSLAIRQDQQEYLLQQLASAKTPLQRDMIILKSRLQELQIAMSKIQEYLGFWSEGDLTWAGIFTTVNMAAIAKNVRPALLLGVLRAETIYGTYMNSCSGGYKNCMGPREESFFEQLTSKLCKAYGSKGKFNYCKPETLPVSKAGAMGFAQFIPSTWEQDIYKCKSGVRVNFPDQEPNPYFFNHAMFAMAYYLGNAGASGRVDERKAVYAYNNSDSYVNRVMDYTEDWQYFIDVCHGLDFNCPDPDFQAYLGRFGIPKQ